MKTKASPKFGKARPETAPPVNSNSGGCLSWKCLGIVCLLVFSNILTSIAWFLYIRMNSISSSETSRISDEIMNILKMSQMDNEGVSRPSFSLGNISAVNINANVDAFLIDKSDVGAKQADKSYVGLKSIDKIHAGAEHIDRTIVNSKSADRSIAESKISQPPDNSPRKPVIAVRARESLPKRSSSQSPKLQELTKVLPSEKVPVLGPIPSNGTQPLWGFSHKGQDAIFALATNYPTLFYKRFVGSLRKSKYEGDIVLAVSPPDVMKDGVEAYLKSMQVLAYPFEVVCQGIDNCMFKENFLGYPDPRPMRTFANIRYALYEYWLSHYAFTSYILILDFRDTFFQLDPFLDFGPFDQRLPKYELQLYEENFKVKNIGKCKFNSLWVGRCFGKPALKELKDKPVLCSGSTLGSYIAVRHYITTMLSSMDKVRCWLKGIESDQGYQNYLYYNHYFDIPELGEAVAFRQGDGVVNTIGAMNGFRVPKNETGPLDTFWKIRDSEGYILNNDGTRSACVHQWDRWYKELVKFIDTKLF